MNRFGWSLRFLSHLNLGLEKKLQRRVRLLTIEIVAARGHECCVLGSVLVRAVDGLQAEPRSQRFELGIDRDRDGAVESDVAVDGVHAQLRALAVRDGIDLAHESIVVEDRKCEVAPPSLRGRLVHLQHVLEVEQLAGALAVMDQPVER